MEKRNWFWTFIIWNTWNVEKCCDNKELNFTFAQPTNRNDFSDKDDSEFQEEENDSRSQVSHREYMINKTKEVWVNEEFENDSENGKSIKEKKIKGDNQTKNNY